MLPELTNTMLCVGTAQILKFFLLFLVSRTQIFRNSALGKLGKQLGLLFSCYLTVSKIKSCKLWATYAIHMCVKPKSWAFLSPSPLPRCTFFFHECSILKTSKYFTALCYCNIQTSFLAICLCDYIKCYLYATPCCQHGSVIACWSYSLLLRLAREWNLALPKITIVQGRLVG